MTAAANATDSSIIKKANPKSLDGDAQLRRIARAGRQWKMTIGRQVDMESESLLISIMLIALYLSTATSSLRVPALHRVGTAVGG
jgi:hypothetical protein